MISRIKFLISLGNLIKNGAIKTVKQAMNFAEQQFGKIDKSFTDDIINVFKKEGKTKKGELVPIKKKIDLSKYDDAALNALAAEGNRIKTRLDELGKSGTNYDEFKKLSARKKEIDDILSAAQDVPASGIGSFKADMELAKISEDAKKTVTKRTDDIAKGDPTGEVSEIMEGLATSIKQGGKGLDPREGVVRAAAREILNKNKIKIGKEDPIDLLRKTYGEDALEAVDAIGDDLLNTQTYGEVNDLLTKHKLFDFKPKKVFGYDQNVVSAEKIRKAKEQEAKHKKMLEDWEPDREPSAHGGIAGQLHLNRTGYFAGRLVKGYKLGKAFWKLLKDPKKIRAAVDNIFPTGDYKYDAEMAAEALVELNPKVFGGKLIDDLDDATRSEVYGAVIGPIQQQALVISKMKKARATAGEIKKGVADVMQDTSKAGLARSIEVDNLKLEFPGITDDMINDILIDNNPQRIAEIKATMKEAMKMREKGMGSDEIIQMFRKTPRTKQADGGLINILKL